MQKHFLADSEVSPVLLLEEWRQRLETPQSQRKEKLKLPSRCSTSTLSDCRMYLDVEKAYDPLEDITTQAWGRRTLSVPVFIVLRECQAPLDLSTSASSSFRRAEPEMQWVALPRGDRVPEARREKGQPFKRRLESTGTCQCLKPRGTVPRGGVRCSNHQPDLKIFTGYALSARSVGGGGVWGVRRGAVGSGTWDEGRGGEGWGWTISLL